MKANVDLSPAKRVEGRVTNLVMRHSFFASCVLHLDLQETDTLPTAATDGTRLMYNPDFVAKLGDSEISGLLAHEIMHCVLGHLWRIRPEWDRTLANIAGDYEINNWLEEYNSGWLQKNGGEKPFALPNGALLNPKYDKTWCFETIYLDLEREQRKGNDPGKGRSPWGEFVDPPASSSGDADGTGKDGKACARRAKTERDWADITGRAEQASRMMGNLPAGFEKMLDKARRPEIPWTEYMRRYFDLHSQDDFDPRIPDRRFMQQDIYLPTLRSESMGELVVGLDTSGSIYYDEGLFERFLGELGDIVARLRPAKTTVLHCDTEIHKVDEYSAGDTVDFKPKGGGGTAFEPFFEWVEENHHSPRVLVIFTDGQGSYPSAAPGYDVLWVDYGDYKHYPFGDVIRTKPHDK